MKIPDNVTLEGHQSRPWTTLTDVAIKTLGVISLHLNNNRPNYLNDMATIRKAVLILRASNPQKKEMAS